MSEIDSIILNGTEYTLAGGGGTPVTMYSITNNLTNVANSNGASSIREGRSYSATLSVLNDATLDSVKVTMGGADITSSVWNAQTMAISIPSVTNDIVITAKASVVITQAITWSGSGTDKTASPVIDARENDVYIEIPFVSGDSNLSSSATDGGNIVAWLTFLYNDAEMTDSVGRYNISTGEIETGSSWTWNAAPNLTFGNNTLVVPHGYYAQLKCSNVRSAFNSNGNCNTYLNAYGNSVILQTPEDPEPQQMSNAEATDRDLLQMYSLNAVSLTTDTIADTTSYEGVIEEAKNAWMTEYGGNINKIPLIIHTDQHSTMTPANSSAMWETIDNMVSWYDISKVINLGDTTNSYENFDNPTLGDSSLESYLEATKAVPFSKRIEVFGNHDCMKIINATLTYIPQEPSYLNPYFKNVMARRTSNNGYHVTYDPYFNVKYVVISNYDYVDASHYELASPEQYDWLIEELSKNDGYDIIVCSHVSLPWWQNNIAGIITARINKTSGTVTDKLSGSHSFDFSNCQSDLLVCLHGHDHADNYAYDVGVLSQGFDNYYESFRPIFFVIVDRASLQLKIWKVTNTPEYTLTTRPLIEST